MSSDKKNVDLIDRGNKKSNNLGVVTFVGLRLLDPWLQYNILQNGWGTSLIERLGGNTLPRGPAWLTNTPIDHLGLSPYRFIIFGMSVGAVLKQTFHMTTIMQEEIRPAPAAAIGVYNALINSASSLLFVCAQTSASVNGEHFPQTPLIVGASLYAIGLSAEWFSEVQRAAFKRDPKNKGKLYTGGLFGISRHVNYFSYTVWRGGYALAAGGWIWGAVVAAWLAFDFTARAIPVLQEYLEDRVS